MLKTTHFSIQCPQCGAVDFQQPDDVQDDDLVTCDFCGLQIQLSELKEVGLEQAKKVAIPEAKKIIEDMLKKTFKGKFK